ncbi:MAG: metalloregulator ArsR/SmtB family transcription factor [Alphaproteobacteria bacterium]|nr:metalloregulator ArsR/SmtB family transcription factor [Alphaproteobacteria bacterium]
MSTELFERLSLLSEPLRVRMLRVLAAEELGVGELARVVQTSQPTVSRHLKQLHAGGFVEYRKAGTASLYRFTNGHLPEDAAALWRVVRDQVDADGGDPASQYAEDLRRLEQIVAQRAGDSEELFRRLGSRWDGVRQELFGSAYVVHSLLAMLPPDLVVADLGCGTGATLPMLAPVCARVHGIDREAAMLEVAAERTADLDNVVLHRGLLDALPLDEHTVDIALCELVLHHVRDLAPVFVEVARVLRPGGRLVVVDMAEHDRDDLAASMGHQHLGFSQAGLAALATRAGLSPRSWRVLPPDAQAQGPGLFVAVFAT